MSISKSIVTKMTDRGFTLVELLVVLSVIGLLPSVIYASFDESRAQARDRARMAELRQVQLVIEQYRAQTGSYPLPNSGCNGGANDFIGPGSASAAGFVSCPPNFTTYYISGLVPNFTVALPLDSRFEFETDRGYYYRSDGYSYKLMAYNVVENLLVTDFSHEFARCPKVSPSCPDIASIETTYAVYSRGAEDW